MLTWQEFRQTHKFVNRKHAKNKYVEYLRMCNYCETTTESATYCVTAPNYSLDCCAKAYNPIKVESNPMNYLSDKTTLEIQQRDYFRSRASKIQAEAEDRLQIQFGIRDDNAPSTPEELVARIQSGKYKIRTDAQSIYLNVLGQFSWRDPDKKTDRDGYAAANKKLSAAYNEIKDEIMALPLDQLPAKLKEFEDTQSK